MINPFLPHCKLNPLDSNPLILSHNGWDGWMDGWMEMELWVLLGSLGHRLAPHPLPPGCLHALGRWVGSCIILLHFWVGTGGRPSPPLSWDFQMGSGGAHTHTMGPAQSGRNHRHAIKTEQFHSFRLYTDHTFINKPSETIPSKFLTHSSGLWIIIY